MEIIINRELRITNYELRIGNGDHGFKRISRISRILICVNLRNLLKSVIGNG
jgi:hypothetical protein